MLMGGSSGSLFGPSSLTGMRDAGAGDELWTTMAGVDEDSCFLGWVRSEFRRDRERVSEVGGGDFNRGEMGQWGVVSPELDPDDAFRGRGTLEGSWDDAGGSWGMLAEDSARWMAAAEGTVVLGPARLGPLFGETSVLLLRERRPDLGRVPEEPAWRCDGRAGEVSREDCGELAFDGEPDTFRERAPFRLWCRIGAVGAVGALSDAGAGAGAGGGARCVEDSRVAVGEVWGGVVDSAWPEMERKASSAVSVVSVVSGMVDDGRRSTVDGQRAVCSVVVGVGAWGDCGMLDGCWRLLVAESTLEQPGGETSVCVEPEVARERLDGRPAEHRSGQDSRGGPARHAARTRWTAAQAREELAVEMQSLGSARRGGI